MTWILDLLKSFWKPLAALLAGVVIFCQRWRNRRQSDTIRSQEAVIRGHEAKEEVRQQDREINAEAESKIDDIRGRVQQAETPEKAAQEVSDGLNEFFGGGK